MDGDKQLVKIHATSRCGGAAVIPCSPSSTVKSKQSSGIDRISSLADELLIHILSFLPTDKAIVTSILSRRWRHIYTWIPNLELDTSPINDCLSYPQILACFVTHVKKVLKANQCTALTKFHLKIGLPDESRSYYSDSLDDDSSPDLKPTLLRKWISYPLLRKVKELNLSINVKEKVKLPKKVFTCETLEVLKLCVNLEVELPKKFCLPNLKVCHLNSMYFPEGGFLRGLLSGCPSIEDLSIRYCSGDRDLKTIHISSPSLRILVVNNINPVIRVPLQDSWGGCSFKYYTRSNVVLETPNLQQFKYVDRLVQDYSIGNLNVLVKASLYITDGLEGGFQSMLNLLRPVSNVRYLTLRGKWLMERKDAERDCHQLPVFRNLQHLKLGLPDNMNWRRGLLELLSCSPSLKTLTVTGASRPFQDGADESSCGGAEEIPSCLRFHLEKIVIRAGGELEMVAYFLKNASVLQNLEVAFYGERVSETALKKLPRSSLNCTIKVLKDESPSPVPYRQTPARHWY